MRHRDSVCIFEVEARVARRFDLDSWEKIMKVLNSPVDGSTILIDVDEVATMCGCSTRHVRRLADAGRMPSPIRLGALLRFNRSVIEQWIAEGCRPVRHAGAKGGN